MTEKPVQKESLPIDDDLVPEDDRIIGKAFRWSMGVFAVIAVVIGGTVYMLRRPSVAPAAVPAAFVPPQSISVEATPPQVRFNDITGPSGIEFTHTSGAYGDKLLPESMGSGCAFFDYDHDGDQDVFLVNAANWPDHPAKDAPPPTQALYQNDGKGRFSNVTSGSGLDVSCYGTGVALGDYDNDGDVDLFLAALGPDRLFRNDAGKFTDVTAKAAVAGDPDAWSTSAGFFDADNDGDLDLFVCTYVNWSKQIDFAVDYRLVGVGRAYGPPMNFEGSYCRLHRNNGDGTFTDVSAEAGIQVNNPATDKPMAKALGVSFIDLGRDGRMDIIVANDTVAKFVFKNKGDCLFEEVGADCGMAYDNMGNATGSMGIDVGDYRNEGVLAVGIGNFANEMTSLYVADEDPWRFNDAAIAEGVGAPSRLRLKFGLFFFDYDLDSRLDLFQTNGHIEDDINKVQPSQHYEQPSQLFWNCGPAAKACYAEVPADSLGDLSQPVVGRGSAFADIDADGDLDVLLTQVGRPAVLLRNDQALGHHWLRAKLVGNGSNRDAIGAWVELLAGGEIQRRQVMPTRSYMSQSELPLTFGLGASDKITSLRVLWPDGSAQEITDAPVDQLITIRQSAGALGSHALAVH